MLNQTHQQILFMQVTKMMVDFPTNTVIALVGAVLQWTRRKACGCSITPRYRVLCAKQKFLDIRKRTYKIAKPEKTQFVLYPNYFRNWFRSYTICRYY